MFTSNKTMRLQSNGGKMTVNQQATMTGYVNQVRFSNKAISDILALSNVIRQYRVTYDSDEKMFVVRREDKGMPNMEFRMHESGLHYFDPRNEAFIFVNIVSGKKEGFTQRQIKGAEAARTLYATLSYPSWKDFRWIVQSNQIKDCPMTAQNADNDLNIWGKSIAALKGKATRTTPSPEAEDMVKVPKSS
jgi:hypothetical protein